MMSDSERRGSSPANAAANAAEALSQGTDGSPTVRGDAGHEEATATEEEEGEEQPPRFEPLFTLLTNATTNTTVHPRVHYVFNDDDPSIITNLPPASDPSHRALVVDLIPTTPTTTSTAPTSSTPAPTSAPIITPLPGNWAVSWASSLNPAFALTDSHISLQENEGDGGSTMLRLEGVEREPVEVRPEDNSSLPSSGSGLALAGREDVDGLADEFKRRMGVLKRVVGEGERRREVVGELVDGADAEDGQGGEGKFGEGKLDDENKDEKDDA